jgi:folate-binding protein YgfZ
MLAEFHENHGRAFVEIGGYQIPVYYKNAVEEYHAAQKAAIMDRGFAGKLRVFGKDREALLHRLTANEMRNLPVGGGVVNIFTNAKGRVVDVVEMFMEEDSIFLLTSPGRAQAVKEWIEKYTFIEDVRCEDVTAQLGVIALFGDESAALLQQVFEWNIRDLPAQYARAFVFGGQRVLVQRSGTISPTQFNLILPAEAMIKFWQALLATAAPIGHAAYEMLRIHRGLPVMDKEITEEYNPHEVGLHPFINFDKGCYIGQEVIARLDTYQKVQRQLAGVRLETPTILFDKEQKENRGDQLFSATPAPIYAGDQLIGQLTSACFSPGRSGGIGLAVVRKQFAAHADAAQVRWPERIVPAHLQVLPFKTDN